MEPGYYFFLRHFVHFGGNSGLSRKTTGQKGKTKGGQRMMQGLIAGFAVLSLIIIQVTIMNYLPGRFMKIFAAALVLAGGIPVGIKTDIPWGFITGAIIVICFYLTVRVIDRCLKDGEPLFGRCENVDFDYEFEEMVYRKETFRRKFWRIVYLLVIVWVGIFFNSLVCLAVAAFLGVHFYFYDRLTHGTWA